MLLLALATAANAASLDALDVGGLWGTPNATNPTAVWWNPASLSAGEGHRYLVEVAPIFATNSWTPAYGDQPTDVILTRVAVPFLGFATDLGVDGLGVAASLQAPIGRVGYEQDEPGPGRWFLRDGSITAVYGSLAASYQLQDMVSFGASVSAVRSSFVARTDMDTLPTLYDEMVALGQQPDYTDDDLRDPDYALTTQLDTHDTALAWSAGVRVDPTDKLSISAAFLFAPRLTHTGDITLAFGCPPESDELGRFGAEAYGICDTTYVADATVRYALPHRAHLGVQLRPTDQLALELMGAWVGWARHDEVEIVISGVQNRPENEMENPDAADIINQTVVQARDNQHSFFIGADGKLDLTDQWLVGGRLLYDHRAVPSSTLITANLDSSTIQMGLLGAWSPTPALQLGLNYTHHFILPRAVDDSAFAMTLDPDSRNEPRYFLPSGDGVYTGRIDRIGLSVGGSF